MSAAAWKCCLICKRSRVWLRLPGKERLVSAPIRYSCPRFAEALSLKGPRNAIRSVNKHLLTTKLRRQPLLVGAQTLQSLVNRRLCAACIETTCTFALEGGGPADGSPDPSGISRRLMQEGAQQCCQTCECEESAAEPTKTCAPAVEGDECDDPGGVVDPAGSGALSCVLPHFSVQKVLLLGL